jgi:benzoyl-CoA reductase/2-hydroxyglutaryl-CoA dehydratase subunit BcrC/BadD/HgdB
MTEKVGFTTTIPIEILHAARKVPVDLNNVLITSPNRNELIEQAEIRGFPRNLCGWVKGIYGVVRHFNIKTVIGVTQGDCSNTQALMETLQEEGVTVIPFSYPYDRDPDLLQLSLKKLMNYFGVNEDAVQKSKNILDMIRNKVHMIDRMTWQEDKVRGQENHYFQVSCSDMNQDNERFKNEVEQFIAKARHRKRFTEKIRLGYIGVPPIFTDLYPYLETLEARVVFNETQRQFSMPFQTESIIEQYLLYTYPYDIFNRINDIEREVRRRRIDGLVHYVQSFCFRQIEDLILRRKIKVPVLTLEGDKPAPLDARNRMKIEVFIEMLLNKKAIGNRQ